ncbi:MAG: hypothetical protein Ta2A_20350 [Treponemataceae bacterium]|nr:MAG: hypothetical protein Ta2A_20350 [Treponemataceae bacterium]
MKHTGKRTGENKPALFAAVFFAFSLGTFYWGAPKAAFFSPVMPYFGDFSLNAFADLCKGFFVETKKRALHKFFDASVFVYGKITGTAAASDATKKAASGVADEGADGVISGPMLPDDFTDGFSDGFSGADGYFPSPELSDDDIGLDPFFLEGDGEIAFEGAIPSELFDDAELDDFLYSGDVGGTSTGLSAGTYLDANDRLRRIDFEEEITALLSPRDLVSSDSKNVMRRKLDKSGRLESVTYWSIVDGRLQLSARIAYTYTAESRLPAARKTQDYYRKTDEETSYTAEGAVKKSTLYYVDEGLRDLASSTEYEYDANKNVSARVETTASTGSRKVTRYMKTATSKEWDFEVLLDGVLTTKRHYLNDTDYVETEYFPDGFSAVSHYEKGALKLVQYMKNGQETRRQEF